MAMRKVLIYSDGSEGSSEISMTVREEVKIPMALRELT